MRAETTNTREACELAFERGLGLGESFTITTTCILEVFGPLLCELDRLLLQTFCTIGDIGKNANGGILHLYNATRYCKKEVFFARTDDHRARFDSGEERNMIGKNGDFPHAARQRDRDSVSTVGTAL